MNTRRLRQIAKDIEANATSFDMTWWSHECGTPSCIGGFACARYDKRYWRGYVKPGRGKRNIWERARRVLGLSPSQADLFEGWGDDSQAVRTIHHLIKTGIVDWEASS